MPFITAISRAWSTGMVGGPTPTVCAIAPSGAAMQADRSVTRVIRFRMTVSSRCGETTPAGRRGCICLVSARVPIFRRELEACELESWCHGASDQRPFAEAFGGLPHMGRDDRLRALAGGKIGAELLARHRGAVARRNRQRQRGAGTPMPDLDRVEA